MRKGAFLPLVLLWGALVWCARDKSPLGPVEGPAVCPQHDIPWPSLANSPWPMYRHDPQSTGRSPYVGPRKGRIKWTLQPEDGGLIWEAIVIGPDSTIYFTTFFGHLQSKEVACLYAVAPDGVVRWRLEFETRFSEGFSAPLLTSAGSILFTGLGGYLLVFGTDGSLFQRLPLSMGSDLNVNKDGTLYLVERGWGVCAMRQDGAVLWRASTDGGICFWGGAISPDGGTLYCYSVISITHSDFKALCAYHVDGTLSWKFILPQGVFVSARPVIGCEGNVYFGTQPEGPFYCVSPSGEQVWSLPASSSGFEEAAVAPDGRVIFYSYEGGWEVVCADHRGGVMWKYPLRSNRVYAAPVCDREGVVYVFTDDVVALDPQGEALWRVPLPGNFTRVAGPALGADRRLYLGTYSDRSLLIAIE